jgi:hypothetical protein
MKDHGKGIRKARTTVTRLTPRAAFTGEMTPRTSPTSRRRRRIPLSRADLDRFHAARVAYQWEGASLATLRVRDLRTQRMLQLRAAPCGLDCFCDAVIVLDTKSSRSRGDA